MKKLLIVFLALAMVFAFAACGDQAPAEEPAAEETEAVTVSLEEGLPTLTLNETAAAGEVTEAMASYGIYEYYVNAYTYCDLLLYRFDALEEEMNAQQLAEKIGEEYGGCTEAHEWDGIPYTAVTTFDQEDSGNYILEICIFDGAECPVAYGFAYHTEETQIADTPLYMWMPKYYVAGEVSDELAASGLIAFYEDTSEYLADMTVYSWSLADWDYASDAAAWEALGIEVAITEDEFNAIVTPDFTVEDIDDYYAACGYEFTDQLNYEVNGLKANLMEVQREVDGVVMNLVKIEYLIDGWIYELDIEAPLEMWPAIGDAYLNAVFVK